MKLSRRIFLKKSGLISLSSPLILNGLVSCNSKSETQNEVVTNGIEQFGIQLWTIKEDMAADPKGTLKALADYGYKQIESFTGDKGIFWGMTAKDFKTYLGDLGLEIISSHVNPDFTSKPETEEEFKKLADEAASIGIKYLINPFPGETLKTEDDWKKISEGLNRQGQISKSVGIKTGYHNHHFEFLPTAEGSLPEEIMLKNTDASLVDFELDLYWIVKAGQDPHKWLKDYSGRFKLVHIKDLFKSERIKEIETTEKPEGGFWPLGASTVLGNGQIDFPNVLKTAKESGVAHFIVEQERFDNSSPFKDSEINANYMKAFKFA